MAEGRVERRLAAIMVADIAGYSRLMGSDEEGTLAAVKVCRRELIDPKIAEHRGRLVKNTGDGALVEFASAVDAVNCAMEIQRAIAERNVAVAEERRVEFRIGINVGDVIFDDGDLYGDGVNIAARLESLARPGAICFSEEAYKQVRGKLPLDIADMGEQQLKNIAQPVHVYAVRPGGEPRQPPLALPNKPSIAVLPFQNMSGDPEQEHFTDGMSEDIITALSKVRWFIVIARHSSFAFKGKTVDVKQVGRTLDARYVLEGSVRKVGNRVRITAQLIDALSGAHVWAERYDRELADIFAVQDEITEHVVAAIQPQLYAAEGMRIKRKRPESLDAWESVIGALSLITTRTQANIDSATELLKKAISSDPTYCLAYSLLSFSTLLTVQLGWEEREDKFPFAASCAEKALSLDPDEPWAHFAIGFVCIWDKRPDQAIVEGQKSIQLNPNFAMGYYLLALASAYGGNGDDALRYSEKAAQFGPRDLLAKSSAGSMNNVRSTASFIRGNYLEGKAFAQKAIQENSNLVSAHRMLVINCALAGETEEAKRAFQRLKDLLPNISQRWTQFDWPFVRSDDQKRLRQAFSIVGRG